MQRLDITNQRFGSVVAIRPTMQSSSGDMKWILRCDCGNEFEANAYPFRSGKRFDCPKCGFERRRVAKTKHGAVETSEYSIWANMLNRCRNKNEKSYKNYGGRGIRVCARWQESFNNFLADMGPRPTAHHSLDRIDNDKDYAPNNCRWATAKQQCNNKRTNVRIGGKTIAELAEQHGFAYDTLRDRYVKNGENDLLRPLANQGAVTFNGITDTYAGWEKRTGIKASTIAARILVLRWTTERALTQATKS